MVMIPTFLGQTRHRGSYENRMRGDGTELYHSQWGKFRRQNGNKTNENAF